MRSHPRWCWISLIPLQVIQLLSLAVWFPMAMLGVMAFDAPGSQEEWQPWAFVLTLWSYPLWLLVAAAASWALFGSGRPKLSLAIAILFTLPGPLALAGLFLLSIFESR